MSEDDNNVVAFASKAARRRSRELRALRSEPCPTLKDLGITGEAAKPFLDAAQKHLLRDAQGAPADDQDHK